jgi:hypothetical protein
MKDKEVQQAQYDVLVPPENHIQEVLRADQYKQEIITFLLQNRESISRTLDLAADQEDLIDSLVQSSSAGRLQLLDVYKRIHWNDSPSLILAYNSVISSDEDTDIYEEVERKVAELHSRNFELLVKWTPNSGNDNILDLAGEGFLFPVSNITILGFPKIPQNSDEAGKFYLSACSHYSETSTPEFKLIDEGKTIEIDWGAEVSEAIRQHKISFLGHFASESLAREVYLFGMTDLLGLRRRGLPPLTGDGLPDDI